MTKKKLKDNLSLPIQAYNIGGFYDDRFAKIKILVMHDGVNLNGTNFAIDVIEEARNTLQDIPILAYIRKEDGQADFKGHESELVLTNDGDVKERYLGRPIGVIPADNNYHYEIYDDKTYVAVDGYIWTDYANEALDILERDGSKSQSMEIKIDGFEYVEDTDVFNVTSYRYRGITLLGDDIRPAMVGAKAELQHFSYPEDYFSMVSELNEKLKEYSKNQKEVNDVEEEKVVGAQNNEVQNEEVEITEIADENSADVEVIDLKETEVNSANEEEAENDETAMSSEEENSDSSSEESESEDFTEESSNEEPIDNDTNSETQSFEETLNTAQETIAQLNTAILELNSKLEAMNVELSELREYKADKEAKIETAKKDQLIEEFSVGLTDEELSPIIEKKDSLSYSELKTMLNDVFTAKMLLELQEKKGNHKKDDSEPVKMAFAQKESPKSRYCV